MDEFTWILTTSLLIADLAIRIGFSLRVIMRKRVPSVSFSWLVVILLFPFIGALIYLLFGEYRLGERRAQHLLKGRSLIKEWSNAPRNSAPVDWGNINPECLPLDRQIIATLGIPTMPGNHLHLIDTSKTFFDRMIEDVRAATSTCYFEFYILHEAGQVNDLLAALLEARQRGVTCRLLLDSIGSRKFLRGKTAARMRQEGIEVAEALPAGLMHIPFVRIDLRNHRKIAVIDGEIAYTGSQNLVDPRYFKQEGGYGQWIDTMVRVTGPVVELLTAIFMFDWLLESNKRLPDYTGITNIHQVPPAGEALVQLAPSGPGYGEDTIHNLLLTTIYAARRELVLTTPYFVPDNAILAALKSAAQRGVAVTIIVPEKNDSKLVHYASRARYDTLSRAGVRIMTFSGGLLHAKTITVDSDFCLFGSVNLDMRSFWLNFEITLFIYNKDFTRQVRALQQKYMDGATAHDSESFAARSYGQRLLENFALLLSPLL
ncbi:cardiolipin synthase [Desulfobulbus alkaliphilus]|uniref:cardiolipin synthase n=1 Tax=Desulfobulbus alkaliphilus TaxID=869814 RepID=UPI001963AE95|nr:cardiolipin synthase [Desulfobulbus alkaliphilus]MBM9535488.1 cardiolipin synthase [Desulfobulbus alkaliphilus]